MDSDNVKKITSKKMDQLKSKSSKAGNCRIISKCTKDYYNHTIVFLYKFW